MLGRSRQAKKPGAPTYAGGGREPNDGPHSIVLTTDVRVGDVSRSFDSDRIAITIVGFDPSDQITPTACQAP